jgi:hypothetical protein
MGWLAQRWRRLTLLAMGLAIAPLLSFILSTSVSPPAIAQLVRTEGMAQRVYDTLPDFPKENQYVNKETGQVDPNDTLVGRLIRYHVYTKSRPPFFRLDWKFTLADYLGVYGVLAEEDYPSRAKLRTNPMEADIAAIRKLDQNQRNELVQALVNAFSAQRRPARPVPKPILDLPKPSK